jgi:hypothetical protein
MNGYAETQQCDGDRRKLDLPERPAQGRKFLMKLCAQLGQL